MAVLRSYDATAIGKQVVIQTVTRREAAQLLGVKVSEVAALPVKRVGRVIQANRWAVVWMEGWKTVRAEVFTNQGEAVEVYRVQESLLVRANLVECKRVQDAEKAGTAATATVAGRESVGGGEGGGEAQQATVAVSGGVGLAESKPGQELRRTVSARFGCACPWGMECALQHGAKCQGNADVLTVGAWANGSSQWLCDGCARSHAAALHHAPASALPGPVAELALEFSIVLREWLKPSQMAEVIRRNAERGEDGSCASHDFIDANEAMADAFRRLGLKHPVEFEDSDGPGAVAATALWNAAWEMAYASEFAVDPATRASLAQQWDADAAAERHEEILAGLANEVAHSRFAEANTRREIRWTYDPTGALAAHLATQSGAVWTETFTESIRLGRSLATAIARADAAAV